MTTLVSAYKNNLTKAENIQKMLFDFLQKGEDAGIKIDPILKQKLSIPLDENQKLKVALLGGFSEGKTSIAAAWLGKVKEDMKISHEESSDEVSVYEIGNDITLIDTPGLFGYKEKHNASSHDIEKYKDITKKYISEAHIILYVMNSTNPIKESHKSELVWLFRDLNLLPRTVFVLSRFDEVADVEDEDDYLSNLNIKKDNIKSRLFDSISITEEELKALSIVAVSANPYDYGFDYWLNHLENYKQISHIEDLIKITTDKIEQSGGVEKLVVEAGKSIIKDILNTQLPIAIETNQEAENQLKELIHTKQDSEMQINELIVDANQAISRIRTEIIDYYSDLILQIRGASIETFNEIMERNIGSEGIIVSNHKDNIIKRHSTAIDEGITKIQYSIKSEMESNHSAYINAGKKGVDFILKGNFVNGNNVLAARDLLFAGFKFKPWGAIKFAKGANGALVAFGILLQAYDSYKEHEINQKFNAKKDEIVSTLNADRAQTIEELSKSDTIDRLFPQISKIRQFLFDIDAEINIAKNKSDLLSSWKNDALIIDAEFSKID